VELDEFGGIIRLFTISRPLTVNYRVMFCEYGNTYARRRFKLDLASQRWVEQPVGTGYTQGVPNIKYVPFHTASVISDNFQWRYLA